MTYIIINVLKTSVQENIFKISREKPPHYLQSNKNDDDGQFLTRSKVSQKKMEHLCNERKNCQSRIIYLMKTSFKNEGKIKRLKDKKH